MRFEILGSFSLCESSDSGLRSQHITLIGDGLSIKYKHSYPNKS